MTIVTLLSLVSATLTALSASVKADGVVDADEVNSLESEIYADGSVDAEEVAVLFDIADNCTYDSNFENLVSRAVRDWAYADGSVDASEATHLRSFIEADGEYSDLEIRILNEILNSGASMPDDFKSWASGIVNHPD